ncbi:MAG: DUF2793 domain-containing protein [Parvibaculum sp.]|uniref:DUF2793 domain-containing protein n=1 Tax=Parvibaculum sp. TaxID=2024848 RepID=UPI0032ECCA5E
MSAETTELLGLPYIVPNQAQKHVTHNEVIRTLDALVRFAVKSRDLAAPPADPALGRRHIVADGVTGAWTGKDGQVAAWKHAIVIDPATARVAFPAGTPCREPLTASRTYCVRTDGDDANDGLVNDAGGAFLTIQHALDVIYGTLDLAGFNVTIQLAAATYAAPKGSARP